MKKGEKKKMAIVEVTPAKRELAPAAVAPSQAEILIAQAIDKGVPIDTMERLLVMRRELKAEAAKEAFVREMAAFQAECPVIEKKKAVKDKHGNVRYSYAPLDVIVKQIQPVLKDHGLSYSVDTVFEADTLIVTCTVTHAEGHSEKSSFRCPIDKEAYMSGPQKVGAAMTFGKRYAFCNAFGIMTGDEDTDAVQEEPERMKAPERPTAAAAAKAPASAAPAAQPNALRPPSEKQLTFLHTLLDKYGMPKEEFLKAYKVASTKDLSADQVSKAIDELKKRTDVFEKWKPPTTGAPAAGAGDQPAAAAAAPPKNKIEQIAEYDKLVAMANEEDLDNMEGELRLDVKIDESVRKMALGLIEKRRSDLAGIADLQREFAEEKEPA